MQRKSRTFRQYFAGMEYQAAVQLKMAIPFDSVTKAAQHPRSMKT
jgi:hypothetical protein